MSGHPVIEIFGPTIQGEGPDAGLPVNFLRMGGCDFRCDWCDTMYAVDPALVRENSEKLSPAEIIERLDALDGDPGRLVISGGNPALHDLSNLIEQLSPRGTKIAVETQGTIWKSWLGKVDLIVCSPKPPSSGMAEKGLTDLWNFIEKATDQNGGALAFKIVVFDQTDLEWARGIFARLDDLGRYPRWFPREGSWRRRFLSAGTPIPKEGDFLSDMETRELISARYRWLCEEVASDPALRDVRVMPQLHVLAWGMARGV